MAVDSDVEAELHQVTQSCNTFVMTAIPAPRAVMYLRISLDHTGEGLAVARQREECLRIIEQRGWASAGEYVDNSVSASDSQKNRPGYDALLRDFEAGLFDALVCYDLDRLTRQPRQLEDWIDRAEGRDLALVTANGEADLTTDAGRMFARVKVAVGRAEVDRKSRRQKDAARQRSAIGRPPLGVRLTGYTPGGEVVPAEADVVRTIFARFNGGDSLKGITRYLSESGLATRHGRPWNPSTVRGIIANPRYAGRAVYQGGETGARGSWEPLVSDDAFNVAQARLRDPRRVTNREGTDRKHLGSGLFLCGICAQRGAMSTVSSFSGQRYRCRDACVNRARGPVDEYVRAVISERLRRPDLAEILRAAAPEIGPHLAEVRRLRERLESIAADYDAGHVDGARFAVATSKVKAELTAAERGLAAQSRSEALASTLRAADPVGAFLSSSFMAQRAVIDTLCTVALLPGTRYSRTFDLESVLIEWRGGGS